MIHGANTAFVELSRHGSCSSGSVMVPCPWFPEAAAIAIDNPALDLGVHLTLTSEQVPYRWRPLTAPPHSAGLTDELGYFFPDVPRARKAAPGGGGEGAPGADRHRARRRDRPDPSRRPHGHGADAGVHRDLPPARQGLRAAGAAGEGSLALQSGELCRPARHRALRRARSPRRGRPASRSSTSCFETPWARQDRRRDRLPGDLRRDRAGPDLPLDAFQRARRLRDDQPEGRLGAHRGIRTLQGAEDRRVGQEFGLEVIGMRGLRDELRARQ